jgi:hypothetical protein
VVEDLVGLKSPMCPIALTLAGEVDGARQDQRNLQTAGQDAILSICHHDIPLFLYY